MKRFSFWLVALSLCAAPALRAQDAALEERVNKLSYGLEEAQAALVKLQKQNESLQNELRAVREQLNSASGSVASHEDLKRLAEKVAAVDRKRIEDNEKIVAQIENLGKTISAPPPARPRVKPPADDPPASNVSDKGYEYVIKQGDMLSNIVQAYRDQNIKVTVNDILKANPGLNPNKLVVGKKIFIPAPK